MRLDEYAALDATALARLIRKGEVERKGSGRVGGGSHRRGQP